MARKKIFVIEDEADIREVLVYNLEREGFAVTASADGEEGLVLVRRDSPDLLLLDLMLPGIDGLEICRRLKEDPVTANIPIIMVTAKGEESDIVLGLKLGADDYMVKPFKPRELVARVHTVLRRSPIRSEGDGREVVRVDGVVVDGLKFKVKIDGASVEFTATEFKLLHYLARHPGRVFTRAQLLDQAVGGDAIVIDRNIDVHIRAIRQKLGDYRHLIETQRGIGYRFKDRD